MITCHFCGAATVPRSLAAAGGNALPYKKGCGNDRGYNQSRNFPDQNIVWIESALER